MIGRKISHFKILEEIGAGGMGIVYKAEDTHLKRQVALKFLPTELTRNKEARERFIHEAQSASALDHPNICTIHEIGETEDGQSFIAMACYEGETLKLKIEKGKLTIEDAINYSAKIAEGLTRAHEEGIVHRDIKPANIMITDRDEVKILDFGLAKLSRHTQLTKEGTTLGTVAYMSPEQTRGEAVDHRSDIWSLGIILYEMLTGQLPFKGEYDQAIIYSILNEAHESPRSLRTEITLEMQNIIDRALNKNAVERYQSMKEILTDLLLVSKKLESDISKTGFSLVEILSKKKFVLLFKDLFRRRVPHIIGIYFLISLGITQIMQWLVNRYPLSPNLQEFVLTALVSMIPTVLILAYLYGKSGHRQWTRVEKISVPVNLLVTIGLLFFLFQDKDLGAATKTITIIDEEGRTVERMIPKSEFRKKMALIFFDNESTDPTLNWLQYGIPLGIACDLEQDLYLDIRTDFYEEMIEAGFTEGTGLPLMLKRKLADDYHLNYFISGMFSKSQNGFLVKTSLYETKRGKLLQERIFSGENIFQLIDEMSIQSKYDLGIPHHHIESEEDLPVAEMMTSSMSAFRLFTLGYYAINFKNQWGEALNYLEQAVEEDPQFAYSWTRMTAAYLAANQKEKSEISLQKTMQYIYKFPERLQFDIRYSYYFYKQDMEKAFRIIQNKVELFPDDIEAHASLAKEYLNLGRRDEAISEYKHILELDPGQYNYIHQIGLIHNKVGEYEEALKYYKQYAAHFPKEYISYTRIGDLYKSMGNHEQAKSFYEKALLIEPEKVSVLCDLAGIAYDMGHFEDAVKQYQKALMVSKIPKDSAEVYYSLQSFYELRGQMDKAIEFMHLAHANEEKYVNPAQTELNKLFSLRTYIKAGKQNFAFQTIKEIEKQLKPPLDKFIPFGYLYIYLELEDADNAEKVLKGVESCIQAFQLELLRFEVYYARGKIHELRKEYDQAIQDYQKKLASDPTDAGINTDVGRCYRKLRELKKAQEFIQRNLKVQPFNPLAHYELSLVYYDKGENEEALQYLRKALFLWKEADSNFKYVIQANEKLKEWES
jgi:serine/threonine protein kinase/tetratricopeptide (TPR) repeat protein